jgi:hypothetical protein
MNRNNSIEWLMSSAVAGFLLGILYCLCLTFSVPFTTACAFTLLFVLTIYVKRYL